MISPFRLSSDADGTKEIPIWLAEMIPRENALSVTVGMRVLVAGERVPVMIGISKSVKIENQR